MRAALSLPLGLGLAATLGLAGCMEVQPGAERASDELARLRGQNGFAVLADAPRRTVFIAKGREVVVAPADGFCVARESLDVSGTAAVALLADCEAAPRPFPGIMMISVSGDPMGGPSARSELRDFLATEQGRALLGRGNHPGAVQVVAMRDVGDGLYVLVEDRAGLPLPVLAPRFWRAFVEVNGRMAMITVSAFRENPPGDERMLASLAQQIVALRHANREPAAEAELQLAAAAPSAPAASPRYQEVDIEVIGSGDDVGEGVEVAEPSYQRVAAAVPAPATVPSAAQAPQPAAGPAAEPYGGFVPAPAPAAAPAAVPAAVRLPAPTRPGTAVANTEQAAQQTERRPEPAVYGGFSPPTGGGYQGFGQGG